MWETTNNIPLCVSLPSQEENEGTCPTSSASPSTCSTTHLQKPCTWWGRDIRHRRQGEHTEAHCGFTAYPTTGIPDFYNWGWQVRGHRRAHKHTFLQSVSLPHQWLLFRVPCFHIAFGCRMAQNQMFCRKMLIIHVNKTFTLWFDDSWTIWFYVVIFIASHQTNIMRPLCHFWDCLGCCVSGALSRCLLPSLSANFVPESWQMKANQLMLSVPNELLSRGRKSGILPLYSKMQQQGGLLITIDKLFPLKHVEYTQCWQVTHNVTCQHWKMFLCGWCRVNVKV